MNKNVLEISVRSDLGGGPKHLLDLLVNNNSEHRLFSAVPTGFDYSERIKQASVDSIHIPHRKFSIITFIKIILFCKKNNIKTVHSHGRGAGYYSRPMKLLGFKTIHTLHGVHIEKTILNKIKVKIDQLLTPLTDIFICVSDGEKKCAIDNKVALSSKIKVIYNGVEVQNQKICNVPYPKIAMLGRLSFQKGYDNLIAKVEGFCTQYPRSKFIIQIAGEGETKEELFKLLSCTQFAKEKIVFIGKTNDPVSFLKHHSHFLSFARFEGMPLSVLEAMSLGLPCMVSNVVGNFDIINITNGILFDQENFDEKFLFFLNNDHSTLVQSALLDIDKKFNVKIQMSKTLQIY